MVQDDPPRHTLFKRCLVNHLTPEALTRDGVQIAPIVEERVSALFKQRADAVEEVGAQIAMDVVCGILGLPDAEREYLRDWTNRFSRAVGAEFVSTDEQVLEAQRQAVGAIHDELSDYIRRWAHDGTGRTGLIEKSAAWPVESADRIGLLKSVAFAGNHTSAIMIANVLWLFAEHGEQLRRLRAGGSIALALAEVFRFKSVFRGITRLATTDGCIQGVSFERGDNLLLWLTSANFDEHQYPDAEQFDISRAGAPHLGFAAGIHHCIGAPLARAEIAALLDVLRRRAGRIVLDGAPRPITDPWVDGFEKLELHIVETCT
jgi:cytochrome P450